MQSGLQLLHAKRAGRFQRRTADEGNDSAAEAHSKRDGLYRDYGRRAHAAGGHRGARRGSTIPMQVPLAVADHQRHAAGSQAADLAGGDGTSSEPGRAGGRSDESAFETSGAAKGARKPRAGERTSGQPTTNHHQYSNRAMERW